MKLNYAKRLATALALTMAVSALPAAPAPVAEAASAPAFKTTRTNLYENGPAKGVHLYTVENIKKGYTVKWSLGGPGAEFAELKYISRKSNGSASANKVILSSLGDLKAKNAKLSIVAKVYDTKGKLVKTLTDNVTIKIQATKVAFKTNKIKEPLDGLSVGKSYDFDKTFTPYNSSSVTHWTVIDSEGRDHSSEITSAGVWTPTKDGTYTITVYGRNSRSGSNICSSTLTAVVGTSLSSIRQTAVNKFEAVFTSDVSKKITKDSFVIKESNGFATVLPKSVDFSADGKTVTVTTHTNFRDAAAYTVTCGSTKKTFTASAGEVTRIAILTTTVPANIATPIEYALYDAKGIDVKAMDTGMVEFSANITNGYLAGDSLFLTTPGKGGTITATYTNGAKKLSAAGSVICREAEAADIASADFTLTNSSDAPNFEAPDFTTDTTISLGETAYAHFQAADNNGNPIYYTYVTYSSSDDNALIVESDGRITPIKEGKAVVIVRAFEGAIETNYTFTVTVQPKKKFSSLGLSTSSLVMSNCGDTNYKKYVSIVPYDQFGSKMDLADCTVDISNNSYSTLAEYNKDTGLVEVSVPSHIQPNTYTITVNVVSDGVSLNQNLYLKVLQVPYGTSVRTSYTLEFDTSNNTVDLALKDGDPVSSKTVYARLAQYQNGIFAGYMGFDSATIIKDGKYYTADLSAGPASSNVTNSGSNALALTLAQIEGGGTGSVGTLKKAATGSYTVIMTFGNQKYVGTLRVTDTENAPAVSVKSIVSSTTVTDALALVKDCLSIPKGYEITNCTAVGTTATGKDIKISSGNKLHISTVTLNRLVDLRVTDDIEWKVYVPYTVNVGQTLTNR